MSPNPIRPADLTDPAQEPSDEQLNALAAAMAQSAVKRAQAARRKLFAALRDDIESAAAPTARTPSSSPS
jgi:thioredoxin-like negative regulator of GroEL